jgi:hypothetical protein
MKGAPSIHRIVDGHDIRMIRASPHLQRRAGLPCPDRIVDDLDGHIPIEQGIVRTVTTPSPAPQFLAEAIPACTVTLLREPAPLAVPQLFVDRAGLLRRLDTHLSRSACTHFW